ncbi:MAG: DUF177 domain-containing protein [Actinomycetota bacterium]|nr:DUF177 domain-containing protein [Actinomycetota bacterium]
MHELTISVSELLGRPGDYRDLAVAAPVPGVATALSHIEQKPVHADLRLESVVEGILVTGNVRAPMVLECARCLQRFASSLSVGLCELFVVREGGGGIDDDAYLVSGSDIDLEPMLRDALALELPLNPLCREDCRGYCPHCGADLNAGACDCAQEDVDPRWAELSVLRARLG